MSVRTSARKVRKQEVHRVVQYNVLCSSLAGPSHFPKCDPEYLDAEYRWAKLVAVLEEEIARGSIIALQEVGQVWNGRLHTFFTERNYSFFCRL